MPSQNRAQVDKLLTNVSTALVPQGLIADQIFPVIGVSQSTGKLGGYGTGHLRIENSIKVGRGKYRQVDPVVRNSQSYSIEGHGLEGMVTADDYRNVEQPFDAEQDEALALTTMIQLEKEQIIANVLNNNSIITQGITLSGGQQFSDYVNSDPLTIFSNAKNAVVDGCGFSPDTAIMDVKVRNKLRFHPVLLDRLGFKYNRTGGLSDDELATALDVRKLLVAEGVYESAKEGQASSIQRIWGKGIVLAVLPDTAQKMQTSLGYRMGYNNQQQRQVYKWDINNPPNSSALLVEDNYQFLLSNVNAAYLIGGAIS